MSTLKATNLQHPSAVDPAIVLDADGDVTYAGVHDFSAATVTGAPQGLVHIATETFSAVSSVSLNDVFTSDYDNYRILIGITGGTGASHLYIRLRASGSDATGADYQYQRLTMDNTTVGGSRALSQSEARIGFSPAACQIALELESPAETKITKITSSASSEVGTSTIETVLYWLGHLLTNSYDGFTLYPLSGNLTGTIRVYGYSNGA